MSVQEMCLIVLNQKTFAVVQKGEKMISDGMVRGLREYFKEYKGCKNCKHQPEPLQTCDYGKRKRYVELICSGWEKKDG